MIRQNLTGLGEENSRCGGIGQCGERRVKERRDWRKLNRKGTQRLISPVDRSDQALDVQGQPTSFTEGLGAIGSKGIADHVDLASQAAPATPGTATGRTTIPKCTQTQQRVHPATSPPAACRVAC